MPGRCFMALRLREMVEVAALGAWEIRGAFLNACEV